MTTQRIQKEETKLSRKKQGMKRIRKKMRLEMSREKGRLKNLQSIQFGEIGNTTLLDTASLGVSAFSPSDNCFVTSVYHLDSYPASMNTCDHTCRTRTVIPVKNSVDTNNAKTVHIAGSLARYLPAKSSTLAFISLLSAT